MTSVLLRAVVAASLLTSAAVHAQLYLHGYGHIPTVGTGFLIQASLFCAVGLLVAAGGPGWLFWAAGLLSAGALTAFAMSRTVGLAGFVERGWEPAPYALLSIVAEAVTAAACALWWFGRRGRPR